MMRHGRNLPPSGGRGSQCKVRLDLPAETDGAIAGHVIGYARGTIADRYLLPAGLRAATLADLTGLYRDLLSPRPAGDGDEMRLIAVRGLIDSASSPDESPRLGQRCLGQRA